MSDVARVAILGTQQVPRSEAEETGTAVDALVSALGPIERERALLLRAGGLGVFHRAARRPSPPRQRRDPAGEEALGPASARLARLLATLLATGSEDLLCEALARMAKARLRLPEELLPPALQRSTPRLRAHVLPVLGERGRWLARLRPEWAWAVDDPAASRLDLLPPDLDVRWEDATAAERKRLLAGVRVVDPARARSLVEASWKEEKAPQRLQWLEVLAERLSLADEPLLQAALADRSAQVRSAAARLLWRLPESALVRRVHARLEPWITWTASVSGLRDKLRARMGSGTGAERSGELQVRLPPEPFDPAWEQEGIAEAAPAGMGPRQWWLAQMLAVVPPDAWSQRLGIAPEPLVAAATVHDLANALLNGFTAAALRHPAQGRGWFAPLYDAWTARHVASSLTSEPLAQLAARLTPAEATPRMLALLRGKPDTLQRLAAFARPWPQAVAEAFLQALATYRPAWAMLLAVAVTALPVEMLPASQPLAELPENDYARQVYLQALEQFQTLANIRRAIAQEIPL